MPEVDCHRAINTLKADHSPRLTRWIVIQRERL